jgi:hypothetical protein
VLNNSSDVVNSSVQLSVKRDDNFNVKVFKPGSVLEFKPLKAGKANSGMLNIDELKLSPKEEMVFVFSSENLTGKQTQ